jgi:TonB family protein
MSARAGSARPCYERALRVNSALQGKLTVSVKVDPQGNVCATSIAQDAVHSPEVSNCVMGMFRSARFPAPSGGGCVELQIPLSFVPREGK